MEPNITLLELVTEVSSHAESDAEVIATVVYLVNSGRGLFGNPTNSRRWDGDGGGLSAAGRPPPRPPRCVPTRSRAERKSQRHAEEAERLGEPRGQVAAVRGRHPFGHTREHRDLRWPPAGLRGVEEPQRPAADARRRLRLDGGPERAVELARRQHGLVRALDAPDEREEVGHALSRARRQQEQ